MQKGGDHGGTDEGDEHYPGSVQSYVKGKTSENSMESVYLKTFINELFNGRIVSEKQLDLWQKLSFLFANLLTALLQ